MDFKKVELIGFKSFADKQEIRFDNGVTCIVGPNGCGKSNVADAIRWVLGEMSAKTMRGSSMQDVIFNGTQNRKSLSYCEVSLTFDNTARIFKNIDFDEVVFTRKLFRSGESEYYINKTPARLRDIVDALHECGVSKEGYTIIGQGKVSEILSSKPEDRRGIFEEAVGIAKTKAKRLETMRKLDRTRDNISRIVDITTELERQIEPLSKQAEKARTYNALSEQLKFNEVNNFLYKSEHASEEKSRINARIAAIDDEIAVKNADLEQAGKDYDEHQLHIAQADEYIRAINEELIDKTKDFERQSGEAKLYNEKISYFKSETERLKAEIAASKTRINELSGRAQERSAYAESLKRENVELTARAAKISAELAEVVAVITEGELKAESARKTLMESVESLADIKQNIGSLSAEKEVLSEKERETLDRIESSVGRRNALEEERKNKADQLVRAEKQAQRTKDEIRDVENDITTTNQVISDINSKLYSLNAQISSLESNKKVYQNLKESYGGYSDSVKRLMQACRQNEELGKRSKGVVASVIHTDAKYEVAIETALGGAAQNIVTANPDDAQYLMTYLKRNELGRATFLPVTSIKPRGEGSEIRRAMEDRGALGLARELVRFEPYYDKIVAFLLGNTLIVDDLENAKTIAQRYGFAFRIVTLDGDVLASNGSMTGGSRRQTTSGFLSMDRKMDDISKEVQSKKERMTMYENDKKQLESQVSEQREELVNLNAKLQELRQEAVALKEQVAANESIIADIDAEINSLNNSVTIIRARINEIGEKFTSVEEGNKAVEERKATASYDEEKHREIFDEYRKKREALTAENAEVRTRLSFIESEIAAAEITVEEALKEKRETEELVARNEESIVTDGEVINKFIEEMEKVALTETQQEQLNALRNKRSSIEDKKAALGEQVKQDNLRRDELTAEINTLNGKRYGEENGLAKIDAELEFLGQRVKEEYDLDYESALPLKSDSYDNRDGEEEIKRLKRRISALGAVNPNAIEDFDAVNERYTEMATQRDDLMKAEDDLKEVITQLTTEMSTKFAVGFAKIRSNFSRIFKELFGGGSADLILDESDTDDPLEQGVEIVAEPPGKKLQKISLLSGGEMALTAIAILFAILKLRPMPFVVLDEIEAALDDANVERFANYINNFAQDTQFIVITHKKVTMEHADALYGVTMQEKGVSKIVSVKLAEVVDELGA